MIAAVAPPATVTYYPPGTMIQSVVPGDAIGVSGTSIGARLIQLGQWLRPSKRKWCWLNHWAIVVQGLDVDGHPVIVEEEAKGAVRGCLADLGGYRVVVHPTAATVAQLNACLEFTEHFVGTRYGWLSIVGDGMNDLTGLHVTFGTSGRLVCSALVARAHERLGLIPDVEPSMVQPADLGRIYGLKKP